MTSLFHIRPSGIGSRVAAVATAFAIGLSQPVLAQESCGLCAKEIVIDSALAECFLERYPQLSGRNGSAVAVNLEDCETSRGVVAALRPPQTGVTPPTLRFIASLAQLACIKARLEEPGVVLDPSLTIDLQAC
jgi:hypothetical protein